MEAVMDPRQAARHVPPSRGNGGLLAAAPAVSNREWLPEGTEIAELDELRAEHVRLYEAAGEIGRALDELRRRHEAEDAAYAGALKAQARGQGVELPEVTPPEERAAELAPLEAKARASTEVREEFTQRAVATIVERFEEWAAELDEHECEAEFQVEKARRALAEAEAQVGASVKLRRWLERTAGRHPRFRDIPGRHISYADLPAPPPPSTQPTIPTNATS